MGFNGDDVFTFLKDGHSDGMAIEIYGSIKSLNKINRIPSRIPISVVNSYHREKETDNSHKNERGIEYPTRDKDSDIPFSQNFDVRYFKKLKNRIQASYSCNQQFCPMMKQRMEQHQTERHSAFEGHRYSRDIDSQTVILPKLSRHRTSTRSGSNLTNIKMYDKFCPNNESKQNNTIKIKKELSHDNFKFNKNETYSRANKCNSNINATDLGCKDNYNLSQDANDLINENHNFSNNVNDLKVNSNFKYNKEPSDNNIPLKRTDTRELVTPTRNTYKDYVQKEVTEWFHDVPIYQNLGPNSSIDKDNVINALSEKIKKLLNEINSDEYDNKIKSEINTSLSSIPMWYPGAKRDQASFKKELIDNLYNRIKNLNNGMLVQNTKNNDDRGKSRERLRMNSRYTLSSNAEEEIRHCISMIQLRLCRGMQISADKQEITKALIRRVAPLLKKPMDTCYCKLTLKCAIVEVLNDLPINATSRNKNTLLHRFAEDLATKLLSIQPHYKQKMCRNTQEAMYVTNSIDLFNVSFENIIYDVIKKCLASTRFAHRDDVIISIANIFYDYVDFAIDVGEFDIKKEIIDVLRTASNIPECLASKIAHNIISNVKNVLSQNNNDVSKINQIVTKKISVYTSEDRCSSFNPVTSTPKKTKQQNSINKLNQEEIKYAEDVGNLIRAWMETLPEQFNAPEEKEFKETIIKDLAGEITDEAKLEQLVTVDEKEKWLKYLVYKWLHKLDVFDLEEVAPQIEDFLKRVKEIHVPVLTRPRHGNRQAMANIQYLESESAEEYFVPKGKDILEDEISIWMNEQSDIFNTNINSRNNKIKELADVLQNKLANKRSEKEISKDVTQWLTNIVKTEQKTKVKDLANNLKSRIINLPQDETLAAKRAKKVQEKAEYLEKKNKPCCPSEKNETTINNTVNIDKTMQQFIAKFIEHNYDVDDPMARGAFSHLLKMKLQRLIKDDQPTCKDISGNLAKSGINDPLQRAKLIKELDYIKDVSDWLKNIPIQASYNTVGNRERIDFVIDLAKNILEVEEQREADPEAMDYNMYMASIISQFLVQLPLIEEYKNNNNMMFMIDQLIGKIIVHRKKTNDTIDNSGVHDENIGDFIEEFIRINGSEIADDEVKLEAWSARLINEIKKMVRENPEPTVLSKAHVYNKLTEVPISGDESVKQFDNEFEYIKEISEWLKNLPLLPIDKNDNMERIRMICELTEKISEREDKKLNNPNDTNAESDFEKYVAKWIGDLSLDESRQVIVGVVIQQLINRIDRVKARQENTDLNSTQLNTTKSNEKRVSNVSKKHTKTTKTGKTKQIKNPACVIVDAIEKWSASLPIKIDDDKSAKSMKDDVSKKLFQTVGELSIDPRTYNDDLLYQEVLADEVDAVIEKLPQNVELQKNKEKIRNDLVHNIVEAQKAIKENSAGEHYKHKLENMIEASIPHPVKARQVFDPGFEIYKSRLADLFILENFDHANDAVKMKYERKIKDEIDKYYDSVNNKNAIPLTKDAMYSDLYSALFKVPIPNEASVIREVEEIKTRCEIDAWYEELPLNLTTNLTDLLEIYKILATLAKRIREIEKNESKPADKIHKEIMKWLVKLPLLQKQEENIEQFAKKLQDTLKSSAEQRKCVVTEPKASKSKKGKSKTKPKDKNKGAKTDNQVSRPSNIAVNRKPKKKAAEILIEIVEDWCNQLPVYTTTPEEAERASTLKDNLSTKIIIKISEINMNPEIFNDDFRYHELLDEELDRLLSTIPTCCNFDDNKAVRKMQLINAIKSVKPHFREEKNKLQYKEDLNKTVIKVLGKPHETTAEKDAKFNKLKEEIVENFIQFNYVKDDEVKQTYKIKIHDAVVNFHSNVINKDKTFDPLMRRNQLICELSKIPVPSEDAMKDEVEEIRMKNEITVLFDDLSISDTSTRSNQIKSSLAKKLNEIELNGYSPDNESKMKHEISKNLKKLNKDVKADVIDDFVNKLKSNEIIRRAPKIKHDSCNTCEKSDTCSKTEQTNQDDTKNNTNAEKKNEHDQNKKYHDNKKTVNKNDKKHTSSRKAESKTHGNIICECPGVSQSMDNTRRSSTSIDSQDEGSNEEERCICDKIKGKYCVPMSWYFNGSDDKPFCMLAGYFYH